MYLSGFGLQLEGENYYVPIDTYELARKSDIAAQSGANFRLHQTVSGSKTEGKLVVLDTARPHPFVRSGRDPGRRLGAGSSPEEGMLIAFNAAPDTVAPRGPGPIRALRPGAGRDDARGRRAARRRLRSGTLARQRYHRQGGAVARLEGADALRLLREGA